jgi:hypothetical protein
MRRGCTNKSLGFRTLGVRRGCTNSACTNSAHACARPAGRQGRVDGRTDRRIPLTRRRGDASAPGTPQTDRGRRTRDSGDEVDADDMLAHGALDACVATPKVRHHQAVRLGLQPGDCQVDRLLRPQQRLAAEALVVLVVEVRLGLATGVVDSDRQSTYGPLAARRTDCRVVDSDRRRAHQSWMDRAHSQATLEGLSRAAPEGLAARQAPWEKGWTENRGGAAHQLHLHLLDPFSS